MKALIDLDFVKYAIASIGEDRFIIVTHVKSGRKKKFKNRTEFYGHHSKKAGGWLGETNLKRLSEGLPPFELEEFTIEDGREISEPLENILHSAKLMVEDAIKCSKALSYETFIGGGDDYRVNLSTLLEYKGNRKDMVKPIRLDDVTQYLAKKYEAKIIKELEVDDIVTSGAYNNPNTFIIGVDKDYYGSGCHFYNTNRPEEGIVDCTGFGKLWLDEGKVRGVGRMFKYFQVLSEDDADNYCANCFSEVKWGAKSAYKALKDCNDDLEAFTVLTESFRKLYPEEKTIIGWRGNSIKIDWLYVMQECFDMAHLQRWKGDRLNVRSILKRMKVVG